MPELDSDSVALDTTVNDDTSDVDAEAALEDVEVDEADIALEADDDIEEAPAEANDSDDTEDDDEADDEEEADDEQPALSDEERQKQANHEAAQARIRAREAKVEQIKQDQSAYVEEARANNDPLEIAVRELQVANYNNTVDANQNKLTGGYNKALTDFPVLSTEDPVIQKEIDDTIDAFEAQFVKIDAYGNPAEVKGDLYAVLQAKAESIEKLTGIRAANQVKSKGKEKSKTLVTPQRQPVKPKVDPDIAAFDEEAGL